jgi:hypothetical protein
MRPIVAKRKPESKDLLRQIINDELPDRPARSPASKPAWSNAAFPLSDPLYQKVAVAHGDLGGIR